MPIEASFSWRLLHQLFLQDNGLHLSKWFCESLPQNAADLRLKTALEAIREKCIEMEISSPQETLQFFIGVDNYQSIQKLNGDEAKKDLLRDLVDILGAAMEGPVDGIRIYPMLAGTDLSAISVVNSSKTEILRLSMPLLAPSEIETAVSSVVNGPLLLTESRVRRHLFYIGGVPRWCFEYISLLLQKIDATGNEKLSTGDIDSAFGIINQSYLEKWGKGLEDIDFIKLAAFSVSGVQVNNASRIVGGMKWSRMQDCGLCLLTDDSKVTIPYAIFHRIGRLVPSQYSEAEGCFITCVRGLIQKVDCLIYDKQIGALWKVFGAHFHALRINAFIIIGQPVINLSDLFHGALMVGCDDEVQLIPTKVMQYDDKYGKNIQPEVGCHTCLHSSEGHNHNWLTEGFVVINGDNGNGVDIFFALKKNKCDGYVVCLNQRERVVGPNIGQVGISKLLRAATIEPEDLGVEYEPITVVPMLFSSLRSTNIQELTGDNAVVVTHAQMKAYHQRLWVHPAASPCVNVNRDPVTFIKMVLVGDPNDVQTVAEQLVRGKRKFESVEDFRTAVKRICSSVEMSDEDQIVFS
ncbi:hypothetical protein LEN26_011502 [Aphanomyces euteiches]|nr:hypothetical protein LEN26_011502 [Aphanomyces euteiches]KAH9127243.1 hypothetical protein AeMF1_002440 [Aphanomyces euteiches]KAH9187301.1 hypothetical protein AeNC1_010722 [Aphanomyces euteiches]